MKFTLKSFRDLFLALILFVCAGSLMASCNTASTDADNAEHMDEEMMDDDEMMDDEMMDEHDEAEHHADSASSGEHPSEHPSD